MAYSLQKIRPKLARKIRTRSGGFGDRGRRRRRGAELFSVRHARPSRFQLDPAATPVASGNPPNNVVNCQNRCHYIA
jgi:hypothetical protein